MRTQAQHTLQVPRTTQPQFLHLVVSEQFKRVEGRAGGRALRRLVALLAARAWRRGRLLRQLLLQLAQVAGRHGPRRRY
jgi:hypothetical protein